MQRHKIQFAGSIVKLHKYYQQIQRLVARHFQGVDSRSESKQASNLVHNATVVDSSELG